MPVKNHQHLIQSLSQARPNVVLVLAGAFQDAAYTDEVRRLVDSLGMGDRVRFLGAVRDTPGLLRSVDGFAFCSHKEACPVALLEAMACGLPSVVTDIPAMRDIHRSNETGYVVPVGDPSAFSLALDTLAADLQRRRAMGEAARQRVEECFSVQAEAEAYQRFYLRLLNDPTRRVLPRLRRLTAPA